MADETTPAPASLPTEQTVQLVPDPAINNPSKREQAEKQWFEDKLAHKREGTPDPGDDPGAYIEPPERERPHYKNEHEAFDAVKATEAAARAESEAFDRDVATLQESQDRSEVQQSRQWSPTEQSALGGLNARGAQYERDRLVFEQRKAEFAQHRSRLPQHAIAEIERQGLAEHARLQQEYADLATASGVAQQALLQKNTRAEMAELARERPKLRNPDHVQGLAEYLQQERGIPKRAVFNEQNPVTVAQWDHDYEQHQQEQHARGAEPHARRLTEHLPVSGSVGNGKMGYGSAAEALAALQKSGSMADATAYRLLQKFEARNNIKR